MHYKLYKRRKMQLLINIINNCIFQLLYNLMCFWYIYIKSCFRHMWEFQHRSYFGISSTHEPKSQKIVLIYPNFQYLWFSKDIECVIWFPFTIELQNNDHSNNNNNDEEKKKFNQPKRFHFTKENICKTKIQSQLRGWYKEHIFFISTFHSHLVFY
jgi:hypothetical protein